MRDLARRLEVLDDAHREVAALARLVHAQGEACRRAQPERRLPRAVDVLDGQARELRQPLAHVGALGVTGLVRVRVRVRVTGLG